MATHIFTLFLLISLIGGESHAQELFARRAPSVEAALYDVLRKTREDTSCGDPLLLPNPATYRLCEQTATTISNLLIEIAPSLADQSLQFWRVVLNPKFQDQLLVQAQDPRDEWDSESTFWLLKWDGNSFKVASAGTFLAAKLLGFAPLGEDPSTLAVWVLFASCSECEPIVYLSPFVFSDSSRAYHFKFTYSENHDSWGSGLEYKLPGMGHTVEADIETRLCPAGQANRPHIIQHFILDDGKEEWWVFKCRSFRCDYELYISALPSELQSLWERSTILGRTQSHFFSEPDE